MLYENKVIVFPLGMKTNCKTNKNNGFSHTFDTCKIIGSNRRKTLSIGNAIRLKSLDEEHIFKGCTIFMEGTFTENKIVPFSLIRCGFYFKH